MKKLFSIGSPVILVTLGVALLFIIRKKRKEKRLKRLRGERKKERKSYCVFNTIIRHIVINIIFLQMRRALLRCSSGKTLLAQAVKEGMSAYY